MIRHLPILLVEDDEVGVMTVRRAFRTHRVTNPLYVVQNGVEALDFLKRRGPYAEDGMAARPGLILLDINMPKMNGIEFLAARREDPALRPLPVVVLTTSRDHNDLQACYGLGISGYIVKPVQFANFVEAVRTLDLYWTLCDVPHV